ncbi:hypothetical protein GIB67_026406 [Kingdonia uniflora]|uniref:alcohol dehydrogenase n=1 Tax=Kingdonia uniflora TaxID=39325 RepID=A0A7J7P6W0_9MAGN|nr:hypothetical protein GIB67_026406 [Kingdonia uniflora]
MWHNQKISSTVVVFILGAVGLADDERARVSGKSRIIGVDLNTNRFEGGEQVTKVGVLVYWLVYQTKELQVEKFITHAVPFSEINKAFDLMLKEKVFDASLTWMDNNG